MLSACTNNSLYPSNSTVQITVRYQNFVCLEAIGIQPTREAVPPDRSPVETKKSFGQQQTRPFVRRTTKGGP